MNLGDILKTVGSGLIKTLVPGGGLLIDAVNGFLPDDKKLPNDATGEQAKSAISSLPPEQQASVLSKQYDVDIAEIKADVSKFEALCKVDETGNTTRPEIALRMANTMIFTIVVTVVAYFYAIITKDTEIIKAINDGWTIILGLLTWPAGIVNSYFGKRTKEKQHKYEATTGVKPQANLISTLIGRFK